MLEERITRMDQVYSEHIAKMQQHKTQILVYIYIYIGITFFVEIV